MVPLLCRGLQDVSDSAQVVPDRGLDVKRGRPRPRGASSQILPALPARVGGVEP
jgi:hypothetical protein